MIKKITLLTIVLFTGLCASSQTLQGKIYGVDGALKMVQVANMNSETMRFSNSSGEFEIVVEVFPVTIEFSKDGYVTQVLTFTEESKGIKIFLNKRRDQLSEVVIYSSIIPNVLRRTPGSVSLIDKEELKAGDNFNLVQNLNSVPGVFVGQGALNTNKLNIRGVGSRAQYGTNRIKAYLNGIPLSNAEGELTLDDLDVETIDRIEVFKGPVSSMFGAGLGGAINLYTGKKLGNERNIKAGFDYGSFNTQKFSVGYNQIQDSLSLNFNYHNLSSDGYRINGEYDRIGINASAAYLNKHGNRWSLFYSYIDLKAYIPSSLNRDDFMNNPEKAAFTWNAAAGFEAYSKNMLGLSYEHSFTSISNVETSLFYKSRDGYEPRPFNILDEDVNSVGFRSVYRTKRNLLNRSASFSMGAEGLLENYSVSTFENLYKDSEERKSKQGERISGNEQLRKYLNIFSQVNLQMNQKLNAEVGLNFNTTSYRLRDVFIEDEIDQSGNYGFNPVVSPRAGLSYEAFRKKNFYFSVSHGFSTPSVAETLTPDGMINTDLKTEEGWNYELGFKGSWLENKLYTELSLYSMQVSNLLVAKRVSEDQYIGINAGKANYEGMEFFSRYRVDLSSSAQLQLGFKSTFNFHEFKRFVNLENHYSGNDLPAIPEYNLNPSAEFSFKNTNLFLNFNSLGRMAMNDANSLYTDAYTVVSLKLLHHLYITPQIFVEFNLGVNNIFNEKYASNIVPNAIGFGSSSPRYYYPGNPRNFYGGVKFRFDLKGKQNP